MCLLIWLHQRHDTDCATKFPARRSLIWNLCYCVYQLSLLKKKLRSSASRILRQAVAAITEKIIMCASVSQTNEISMYTW
jgi:hypothetical protein